MLGCRKLFSKKGTWTCHSPDEVRVGRDRLKSLIAKTLISAHLHQQLPVHLEPDSTKDPESLPGHPGAVPGDSDLRSLQVLPRSRWKGALNQIPVL